MSETMLNLAAKSFVCLFILFVVAILAKGVIFVYDEYDAGKTIIANGYELSDVDVFLKSVGMNRCEFNGSNSLRLEYAKFRDGLSSNFVQNAKIQKVNREASSAKTTANAALIMGIAGSSYRR